MATHKIKDPKAVLCIIFFILFLAGAFTLLIVGGILFGKESPKVKYYGNSMCLVQSGSYKTYQCKSRYYWYTCYGPTWNALYGANQTTFALVESERRYRSYIDALNKAKEYEVGSSYSCWYDTRHPTVAQWDKPSSTVAVILLSCGGLCILLSILLFFLAIRLVKQEILQQQQNSVQSYTSKDYIR
ncbi:hypothetical protein I4U23_010226 [Adineta vaga]|nr:hypothetical protein I4U23_010226 [Adineta vaga]